MSQSPKGAFRSISEFKVLYLSLSQVNQSVCLDAEKTMLKKISNYNIFFLSGARERGILDFTYKLIQVIGLAVLNFIFFFFGFFVAKTVRDIMQ